MTLNSFRSKKDQPSIHILDGNLERHMACLEAVAKKVVLKWNRDGCNVDFNGIAISGRMGQGQR